MGGQRSHGAPMREDEVAENAAAEPAGSTAEREREPTTRRRRVGTNVLAGIRVLLVDDEPDARELGATILRLHGAEVRTAHDAASALEAISREVPGVLVSDVGMPREDGCSLVRRVRLAHPTLPAIALSAYARPEDAARALEAGFHEYLTKPVEAPVLVARVLGLVRG